MKQIKFITLLLVVLIVSASAGINISRQFSALVMARSQVQELEKNVVERKISNRKLISQIEYASSSAYLEEQARDKFALGTENDVWIQVTPEKKTNLFEDKNIGTVKPKFQQWFDLFTK